MAIIPWPKPKPLRLSGRAVATTLAGPAPGGYLPLPIQNLWPGELAPCDLFVRTRVPRQVLDHFQLFWGAGDRIAPECLRKLEKLGVSRVYFATADEAQVVAYLHRRLPAVLEDANTSWANKAERLTDLTWFWAHQFLSTTQVQVVEQLRQGFVYIDHLLTFIREDSRAAASLFSLLRRDRSLFSHCLNTSLLGMAFAQFLGWPERRVREVGRGALLHDIGMTKVPEAILTKKGQLTPEEQEEIRKHPARGFHLLKELPLLSRGALLLVLQHHENGDGSGYPEGLKLALIHPLARMMRLIDSFDALVSPRHWRPGNPPVRALWIIRQDWQSKGIYDAQLLAAFIRFLAGARSTPGP